MDADKLRARLREVIRPAGDRPESVRRPSTALRPGTPDAIREADSTPTDPTRQRDHGPETALGGAWQEHPCGRSFVVSRRYTPDHTWGCVRIGDVGAQLSRAASSARLFGAATAEPPFVFFDLETTGLSGGAGTYAFLVGCARFEADGSFVVDQHLMTDYASERPMLMVVADTLTRAGALVSYNGKSFDAPVVETRYLFHRAESPCVRLPHLDMLHPARRLWGANGVECSLTSLEGRVLSARRQGDVAGFEIPARYFHYVRSGDARPLAAVFEHNRLDLISLAGVTAHLLALAEAGAGSARDAREAYGLGRIYERGGLSWRAEEAFERAIALCDGSLAMRQVRLDALRALAIEARRGRRHDAAAARWRQIIDVPGCPANVAREAAEALAIHHEHRVRDLEAAKQFALKSLALKSPEVNRAAAWGDAVRHRLARIERKIATERRPLFSWP